MAKVFVSDKATGVVDYHSVNDMGAMVIRRFWVAVSGGAVREISADKWGSDAPQVCVNLSSRGYTLQSSRETLLATIRREVRAIARIDAKAFRA